MSKSSYNRPVHPKAPAGEPAFSALTDSRMYWPVQRARLQVGVREVFQTGVGKPVEHALMSIWLRGLPGACCIEAKGLPRRAVEKALGDQLLLEIDPCRLIRIRDWRDCRRNERPSSNVFVWDGDWDQRRDDFRDNDRSTFIRDIDAHRHHLEASQTFQSYLSQIHVGNPWRSHQQGVLLDTEERILEYLKVYLEFLDHMSEKGFDKSRGKDELGVAVTREGSLLKLNRGLHRLAMAQHLKLSSIPVRVKAVHRQWWEQVTHGLTGEAALASVGAALAECQPETEPGSLDPQG